MKSLRLQRKLKYKDWLDGIGGERPSDSDLIEVIDHEVTPPMVGYIERRKVKEYSYQFTEIEVVQREEKAKNMPFENKERYQALEYRYQALEHRNRELEQRNQELEQRNRELEQRNRELEQRNRELEQRLKETQKTVQKQEIEIRKLWKENSELQALVKRINQKIEETEKENRELRAFLEETKQENRELRAFVKKTNKMIEETKQENRELRLVIEKANKKIEDLEQAIEKSRIRDEENAAHREKEKNRFEEKKMKLMRKLGRSRKRLDKLSKEIDIVKESNQELLISKESAEKGFMMFQAFEQRDDPNIEEVSIEELKRALNEKSDKVIRLQHAYGRLNRRYDRLMEEYTYRDDGLKNHLMRYQDEVDSLYEYIRILMKRLDIQER